MKSVYLNKNRKKHILVISQYFYPENFRINDICLEWIKRGYKVTVLTGIPNYPQGKFYAGYGLRKRRREIWNEIEIVRIPLIPRGQNSIGLMLNYLSFVITGFFWNIFTKIKADYVFMFEVSPMTQCLIGVWYKKKHKCPLFMYVQDLWPENVEVIAGIHNQLVIKLIHVMVKYIYKYCTKIFATSKSFVEAIIKEGVDREKVCYWPQYAEDFYVPVERRHIAEISEDESFKVIFTGNVGYAQGLDILPQVAHILKNWKICFVIVGEGRYLKDLISEIDKKNLMDKFIFLPRQPAERIPELLAACDVAFLSFADNELFSMTIPAKLQSYMACGMPIVASAKGETNIIIEEAACGICVSLRDEKKLSDAILEMADKDKDELKKIGNSARSYYLKNFDKQKLMNQMDDFFAAI